MAKDKDEKQRKQIGAIHVKVFGKNDCEVQFHNWPKITMAILEHVSFAMIRQHQIDHAAFRNEQRKAAPKPKVPTPEETAAEILR